MDTLDWNVLADKYAKKQERIPYEPNKQFFTKVAFDVFQLNTSPVESLWTLEEGEDGKQYLAAMYGDETQEKPLEATSEWTALADKEAKNVTLLYKNMPIQRFASKDFGFDAEDVYVFQKTLTNKLSSDKDFLKKFLNSQPEEKKNQLLVQFPELR